MLPVTLAETFVILFGSARFVCKTRMSGVSMFRDADDHMTRDCSSTCPRL